MNLRKQLLQEHSKINATYIADYVIKNSSIFAELMQLFFKNEKIISQRAAYSVGIVVDKKPELIESYILKLINNLFNDIHDAVKRNTLRTLQEMEIPESHQGILTNICFDFLTSSSEPIAVKAFSMTVLFNMTKLYPELKEELKIVINDQLLYGTAALTSRGNKILKQLDKI